MIDLDAIRKESHDMCGTWGVDKIHLLIAEVEKVNKFIEALEQHHGDAVQKVDRLQTSTVPVVAMVLELIRERDEARAEVERLRAKLKEAMGEADTLADIASLSSKRNAELVIESIGLRDQLGKN